MCVLHACVAAQQCMHSRGPGKRWEMRGESRGDSKMSHPPFPFHPCMQCDFCFMACGCIKPQSNNLVSSGAQTTDIRHAADCICEPQQHTAVQQHFALFHNFIRSLLQLSATSSWASFACIVLAQCWGQELNLSAFWGLAEMCKWCRVFTAVKCWDSPLNGESVLRSWLHIRTYN